MCEPATIALVTTAVVGAGVKIASSELQRRAEADISRQNEQLARQQAQSVIAAGEQQASVIEAEGARTAGAATAAAAGAGIETTSGSAAQAIAASSVNAAVAAETVRTNAARRAWGFDFEAAQQEPAREQARRATFLGSVGTAIGAAGSAFGSFGRPGPRR